MSVGDGLGSMDFLHINPYLVATSGGVGAAKNSGEEGDVHLQPHGHFEMQRQGQVLICRPSGPFNLAGAMAYEAAFSQQIAGLRDAPWGIVEVATEFEAAGGHVERLPSFWDKPISRRPLGPLTFLDIISELD